MNRFIAATPGKCIGCRTCEIACVLAHTSKCGGACALSHAADCDEDDLSCLSFTPRIKVVKTATVTSAITCHHCDDAPCANACPNGAIVYRQNSVQVDQERCIGCKSCMIACPFGAMTIITTPHTRQFAGVTLSAGQKALAQKCDLCSGRKEGPACASACPTKALTLFDQTEMDLTQRLRRERAADDRPVAAPAL